MIPKVAIVDDNGKVTAKSAGTATIMARTAGGIAFCKGYSNTTGNWYLTKLF